MRLLISILAFVLSSTTFSASIWHVQGKQDVYLFGTIHVLKPDTYPLPDIYQKTLPQCDVLWLEADLNEMEDPVTARKVQQFMTLPAGVTLESQLSPDSYKTLEVLAKKAQVPLMLLQGIKPWAVVNVLTVQIFKNQGFDVEHGLDAYLQRQAKKKLIPVKTFETVMWQLEMFDKLAASQGDKFLEFSTNDMDSIDELVNSMYRYWQQGDVEGLYQQAEFDNYPEVEQAMLIDRNTKWMKQLTAYPKDQTQCVAVGALHMASDHGLIAQFKSQGYKVKQLK